MTAQRSIYRAWPIIVLVGLLATLARAVAPVALELDIGSLQHEGIEVSGIHIGLTHRGESLDLSLHVDRLKLPDREEVIEDIDFLCPGSTVPWPRLSCGKARLEVAGSPLGAQRLDVDLEMESFSNGQLAFTGLRYAGDRLRGELNWKGGDWKLKLRTRKGLDLKAIPELQRLRAEHGLEQLAGRVRMTLQLHGTDGELAGFSGEGRLAGLSYSDAAGEQAAEHLAGSWNLSGRPDGRRWNAALALRFDQGEVYSDPVFLDLGAMPVRMDGSIRWDGRYLRFRKLDIVGGQILKIEAKGLIDTDKQAIRNGRVRIDSEDLDGLYRQLLQPLFAGTRLDDLEIGGKVDLRLQWEDGVLSAFDGAIEGVDLDDRAGRFGANGLGAALFWRNQGGSPDSRVQFEAVHLGKLGFGGAQVRFRAEGRSAWLLEPVSIPFYAGSVELSDLSWIQTIQGPDVGFSLAVRDASLEELSADLGWPPMQGTVFSRVPRARYHDGSLSVDGAVEVRAFDGRMTLRHVRLEELESVAPVLQADMELRRLDLSQLTQTFSFGEIQGRLDGDVRGLRLVAWEPDRFDAHFYSSPDDDLRHRISQRAVENLTELGNGVSGALSASFLRFFDEFSYDRIELKVRQRGDRAWIDGIPAPGKGYYLVRGAGIPRIDVIGRNREVGWKDLLARLKSIRIEGVQMQ